MATNGSHVHGPEYRKFLPDINCERFTTMRKQNAREYVQAFHTAKQPPWFHALSVHWKQLAKEPYKGVTNDGIVRSGLFKVQDESIPLKLIVNATKKAISSLNNEQRSRLSYHIDSPEWRTWSNPEFLLSDKGIRLDEISSAACECFLNVLKVTLSPEGYQKAIGAMRINGFLGNLSKVPTILGELSYNFVLFGDEPSTIRPWGFSFYGHHLCLSVFLYGAQIVISPWFTGAEPNLIDEGPYKDTRILENEERLGLQLMQNLPPHQQQEAQIYKLLKDPAMPPGRWNQDDQRHLCGAYQDNRIVPYEGVLLSAMQPEQ